VNCVNSPPQLLRCDSTWRRHWIKVKLKGTKSNRTGIGARVRVVAKVQPDSPEPMVLIDEVRSGGSYYSQSDLRVHFGLDQAKTVDRIEVRWPSGQVDSFRDLAADRLYVVEEGAKEIQAFLLPSLRKA
jgi:enediyne biosynthesis protein E4